MRQKFTFLLMLLITATLAAPDVSAQKQSKTERDNWFREMQRVKHEYLVKELGLTKDQQTKFFPVYDAMDEEMRRTFDGIRSMEHQIRKKGDKATDIELERAADAMFNVKSKEAAIEKAYYQKFKKLLTKKQLFNLKRAERHFQRKMINEHRKARK